MYDPAGQIEQFEQTELVLGLAGVDSNWPVGQLEVDFLERAVTC